MMRETLVCIKRPRCDINGVCETDDDDDVYLRERWVLLEVDIFPALLNAVRSEPDLDPP